MEVIVVFAAVVLFCVAYTFNRSRVSCLGTNDSKGDFVTLIDRQAFDPLRMYVGIKLIYVKAAYVECDGWAVVMN